MFASSAIRRSLGRHHPPPRSAPKSGTRLTRPPVQDDYQRVFELKKFANVEARVEPTRTGGVIVVFVVTEQKLIKSVIFHGNKSITTETLKPAIDIKRGAGH